jgi:hypothetical protein
MCQICTLTDCSCQSSQFADRATTNDDSVAALSTPFLISCLAPHMHTTTNTSRCFKRTEWQAGTLSNVLSDLVNVLNAKNVSVKGPHADGTAAATGDGPETVTGVTSLPVGQGVLTVQYVREPGDSADVSNVDILTVDMLGTDVVSVIISATETEYQIDIHSRKHNLAEAAYALLIDRLRLLEIA